MSVRATIIDKNGKTRKNKKVMEGNCIFPFKYKRDTHNKCIEEDGDMICATEVNPKTGTLTKYGYCKFEYLKRKKKGTKKNALQKPNQNTTKLKDINQSSSSSKKKNMTKRSRRGKLKIVSDLKVSSSDTIMNGRLNEKFTQILEELADILQRQGDQWRAKSYRAAADTIMIYPNDITSASQLKGMKTIGATILSKLKTIEETGTLPILERERKNPLNILTKVYGIGPKKAKEFIDKGITTLEELEKKPELLTTNMKIGLKYFDDIESRIPRAEIDEYHDKLSKIFAEVTPIGSSFEIVGSYRRGAKNSGDIDIIITNRDNNHIAFTKFLDALITDNIVIEVLSRGQTKSLVIARLEPGMQARRVDFMFTSPEEYPFAILYFTGSKTFNTIMRQRALDLGYTLNEHGLHFMSKGTKGARVENKFPDEQSIFKFLDMEYREPFDRKDTRSVKLLPSSQNKISDSVSDVVPVPVPVPDSTTIKVKKAKRRTLKKKSKDISPKDENTVLDNIAQFKSNGVSALKTFTEADLSNMIKFANNAYYEQNTSLLTDNEYDILREFTLEAFPNNEAAIDGHMSVIVKNKVTLPYEMWSMDKINTDTNALSYWMTKYKGPYVISAKLDGVSGLYSTEGKEPKLFTRGNGTVGQDVSHLIPFLKLPTSVSGIVIRGEFIISKKLFATKYASKFSNPRNFVAGVVNQKTPDPDKYQDIDFVAYEVIRPVLSIEQQMMQLTNLNVEVVKFLKQEQKA